AEEGCGLVIYEYQEGRGIGLMAKLEAYALQDAGFDTVDANYALGFRADCRDFSLAAAVLRELAISRVRLLSNNPRKFRALVDAGIDVAAQIACEAAPNPHSLAYLQTKRKKMGHTLALADRLAPQTSIASATEGALEFASIDVAIRELRAGRMIVLVDDED